MSYDLKFARFIFEELKENHPFFRYPLLTFGDYEPYLHQAEIFYRLLPREPVRFLIADDVGLGKTIEGIMVIDQLIKKRKVKKVLLIVPRVLITQWVYELNRFRNEWNLPVYEYDGKRDLTSDGIYIVSVDTIKRENHRNKFFSTKWDLVVVDEIHKVGVVGNKENLRYKTLSDLVGKYPDGNFLGLSATPHKGNDNDYLKRLTLIDPYLREADDNLFRTSVRAVIQKRNKDNVNKVYEKEKIFPDAIFIQYIVEPTEEEKNYYEKIRDLTLTILREYYDKIGKSPKGLPLLSFMIGRRSLSSPYAGLKTFQRMLENRAAQLYDEKEVEELAEEYAEDEETEEGEPDEIANKLVELSSKYLEKIGHEFLQKFEKYIHELIGLAKAAMANDSRVKSVIELAKSHLDKGDKVIIFTEYKDTAEYIYSKFKSVLHANDDIIKIVTSETLAKEGIDKVKSWLEKGGGKVMIATDVASEGLNLQSANILIHYELPLSIVRFEQRNGRVWRLKQNKTVYIYYLALKTNIEQSILDHYYNKLLEITKGTGSEVNIADALVYKKGNAHKIFNLSQEKESIPIYLGYNDPQKKEEMITSIKIWESVLQGNVDDIVKTIINRIKILKDTMRKFALYESLQGAAIMEIDTVRKLVGFSNRAELKSSLQTFLEELLKKINGKIDNNKIFYPGGVIGDYDPSRIGKIIYSIDQIIKHISKDKKSFVICDAIDYNVYLVNLKVLLKRGKTTVETIDIPAIINSKMQEIPLSKFFTEILPLTLNCRKIYPDANDVEITSSSTYSIKNSVKTRVHKLLENYIKYRQLRGRDRWLPNNIEEIDVQVEIKGGIIGVSDEKDYLSKTLETLKKKGTITPMNGVYRLEGKGEVRYVKIVSPREIFSESDKEVWLYTFSNGALVGVKNDRI